MGIEDDISRSRAAAKGAVQHSAGGQTNHRDSLTIASGGLVSDGKNFAIRLQRQRGKIRRQSGATEVGNQHLTAGSKAGIELAVGQIARDLKPLVARCVIRQAAGDDIAVGLKGERQYRRGLVVERRGDDSRAPERGVERAVNVIAKQSKHVLPLIDEGVSPGDLTFPSGWITTAPGRSVDPGYRRKSVVTNPAPAEARDPKRPPEVKRATRKSEDFPVVAGWLR